MRLPARNIRKPNIIVDVAKAKKSTLPTIQEIEDHFTYRTIKEEDENDSDFMNDSLDEKLDRNQPTIAFDDTIYDSLGRILVIDENAISF